MRIVVGNAAPVVELVTPGRGPAVHFGDTVQFEVTVTDDQPVDCAKVSVTYVLGHDTHGHPQTTANGCTGSIQTTAPSGHDPANDDLTARVRRVLHRPGRRTACRPLTGTDQVVLVPTA